MRRRVRTVLLAMALGSGLFGPSARADLEPIEYTVVSGDSASRIASRHGLTLSALRALNDALDGDRLRIGQTLIVGHGHRVTHRVRRGDSLRGLAARYGVRVAEILRWNRQIRADRILVDQELCIFARRDEPASESVGRPDEGSLVHGLTLPPHPGYVVRDPQRAFVTRHVANLLERGFEAVHARAPRAPAVQIRDASRPEGGPLSQHLSHQSGRDVDIAYYRQRCPSNVCGHHRLTPETLQADLEWALLEPWLRDGSVEYVFVEHALQQPLHEAAERAGATRAELAAWFQWPRPPDARVGVIRHVDGHDEHLHARFVCAPLDTRCLPSEGLDREP